MTPVASIAARALQSGAGPGAAGLGGPGRLTGAEGWNAPSDGGRATEGPAFGETLSNALDRVNDTQKASDNQIASFVAGETENVHEVMIAMNQAELHFQLLTEVRNKLLDGYQELMRMQV